MVTIFVKIQKLVWNPEIWFKFYYVDNEERFFWQVWKIKFSWYSEEPIAKYILVWKLDFPKNGSKSFFIEPCHSEIRQNYHSLTTVCFSLIDRTVWNNWVHMSKSLEIELFIIKLYRSISTKKNVRFFLEIFWMSKNGRHAFFIRTFHIF